MTTLSARTKTSNVDTSGMSVINKTRSQTLTKFIGEVRQERIHILFLNFSAGCKSVEFSYFSAIFSLCTTFLSAMAHRIDR